MLLSHWLIYPALVTEREEYLLVIRVVSSYVFFYKFCSYMLCNLFPLNKQSYYFIKKKKKIPSDIDIITAFQFLFLLYSIYTHVHTMLLFVYLFVFHIYFAKIKFVLKDRKS